MFTPPPETENEILLDPPKAKVVTATGNDSRHFSKSPLAPDRGKCH